MPMLSAMARTTVGATPVNRPPAPSSLTILWAASSRGQPHSAADAGRMTTPLRHDHIHLFGHPWHCRRSCPYAQKYSVYGRPALVNLKHQTVQDIAS